MENGNTNWGQSVTGVDEEIDTKCNFGRQGIGVYRVFRQYKACPILVVLLVM